MFDRDPANIPFRVQISKVFSSRSRVSETLAPKLDVERVGVLEVCGLSCLNVRSKKALCTVSHVRQQYNAQIFSVHFRDGPQRRMAAILFLENFSLPALDWRRRVRSIRRIAARSVRSRIAWKITCEFHVRIKSQMPMIRNRSHHTLDCFKQSRFSTPDFEQWSNVRCRAGSSRRSSTEMEVSTKAAEIVPLSKPRAIIHHRDHGRRTDSIRKPGK